MTTVTCSYCGLPFKVRRAQPGRPAYCCTGCAIAHRVPVDAAGQFPVNATLVAALAVGFLFFNQLFFWLLQVLMAREGRAETAQGMMLVSLGIAPVVWGALTFFQWKAGVRGPADVAVTVLVLLVVAAGWINGSPACAAGGVAGLLAWSLRGFARKKAGGKIDGGGRGPTLAP